MSSTPRRAFMVDDQKMVLAGLSMLVDSHPAMRVVGHAESAEAALDAIDDEVDVVITDLHMGGLDGIALCRLVKEMRPELPVLLLSSADESLYAEQALAAGASGYLMKDHAPEKLQGAVVEVVEGGLFLTREMWDRLLPASHRRMPETDSTGRRLLEAIGGYPPNSRRVRGDLELSHTAFRSATHTLLQQADLQLPMQLTLLAHWLAKQNSRG